MNWYKNIKISMPLPRSTNMPETRDNERLQDYGKHYWETIKTLENRILDPTKIEEEFPDLSYLGSGSYGVAYDINQAEKSGHVLKITKQLIEYNAAKKIIEKQKQYHGKIPHIVYVYQAKKVEDTGEYNIFLIETEKLQHPSENEIQIINLLKEFYERKYNAIYSNENQIKNDNIEDIKIKAEEYVNLHYYKETKKQKEKYEGIMLLYFDQVFYGFHDMVTYLTGTLNLKIDDAHGNNVGIRPETGEYVLFDLGFSTSG